MKQWQALIEQQAQSRLTAQEFCNQKGLSAKTFSARKSKLKKAKQSAPAFAAVNLVKPKPEKPKPIEVLVNGIEHLI